MINNWLKEKSIPKSYNPDIFHPITKIVPQTGIYVVDINLGIYNSIYIIDFVF